MQLSLKYVLFLAKVKKSEQCYVFDTFLLCIILLFK